MKQIYVGEIKMVCDKVVSDNVVWEKWYMIRLWVYDKEMYMNINIICKNN